MRLAVGTVVAFFLLALPQPQPASAAWLVLQGGEVLRTQGAWKIDGSRVLYTTMHRQFTSIPLSEVDVASSAELNRRRPSHLHAETLVQPKRLLPVLTIITEGLAAGQRRTIKKSPPSVPRKIEKSASVRGEKVSPDDERRARTDERRARRAAALQQYAIPAGGSD